MGLRSSCRVASLLAISILAASLQACSPPNNNLAAPTAAPPAPAHAQASPRFRQECLDLKPLQIGSTGRTAPRLLHPAAPDLTHLGSPRSVQGVVIVAAVIEKNGEVCDAQVVKGILSEQPHLVDEPVRQAVLASTFAPATLNGAPVAVVYYLTVPIRR